jgi:hypothetical protein
MLGQCGDQQWWGGQRCENMEFWRQVQLLFNFIKGDIYWNKAENF